MPRPWSTELGRASAILSPLPKPRDDIGDRLHLTCFDLTATQCEDLEQRNGLLHLLVAVDILHDHLGFAVLGDDQGFPLDPKRAYDLGGMGLKVTDRLDLVGQSC